MIDKKHIGMDLGTMTLDVERGRLRFFAKSIGQTDPVYTDLDAARAAGHPDLPVPPTFFFSLELETRDGFGYLETMGVDLRRLLHGEQRFTYHRVAHAGERLTLHTTIADITAKKGGAMELITRATTVTDENGELVAESRGLMVVRNPEVAA